MNIYGTWNFILLSSRESWRSLLFISRSCASDKRSSLKEEDTLVTYVANTAGIREGECFFNKINMGNWVAAKRLHLVQPV